ncbi:LGFP repeat-containing protein [Sinomonas terrae]|uniref:LGFP repeat-containing protein n=1 Tax=Sinomonas terrae TaxID=2908838 RepID=A0ABS9TVR6_9MICC|nr:hypothetical protein [Sinomonas terrae]MCH6468508.1 hypothetical protein [Sinomonas terrae]
MKKKSALIHAWLAAFVGAVLLGASLVASAGAANAAAPPWAINVTLTPGRVGGSGTVTFSTQTLYRQTFSDPQCATQTQTAPDGTLSVSFSNLTWTNAVIRYSPPLSQWPSKTSTATDPTVTTCATAGGTLVPATATVTQTVATWSVDYSCRNAGDLIIAEYTNNPYLNTGNSAAIWGGSPMPLKVPDNGPPPATCPAVALSSSSGAPGSSLTITGTGYTPSSTASVTFDSTVVGSPTVGADGTFTVNTVVPTYPIGASHRVGVTSPGVASLTVPFTAEPSFTLAQAMDAKAAVWGLGAATSAVTSIRYAGYYRNYQFGAVIAVNDENLFVSRGAIRSEWAATGFENGLLAYPTTDEIGGLRNGGVYQNYQEGAIIWSPASGAHESYGPIRSEWQATGFENGVLGYPTSEVLDGMEYEVSYQNYQGGTIVSSPELNGAHATFGPIRSEWQATGLQHGPLSWPLTEVVTGLRNGGSYQGFIFGAIVSSPASGTHESYGPIRSKWAATNFESGPLGYPTTEVVKGILNGGSYQNYQGGAIVSSPASGTHESIGAIRGEWQATGFEGGLLGYPTTDEVGGLRSGGVYQNYQGGAIIWSPVSGAHESYGPIRAAWQSTGFESGRLGYPTSEVYSVPNGTAQNFQGGKITVINGTTTVS